MQHGADSAVRQQVTWEPLWSPPTLAYTKSVSVAWNVLAVELLVTGGAAALLLAMTRAKRQE